jgi:hypothetical protein
VNADEQKLQKQTPFVRRRRSVFDLSNERKTNPLQQPASLEIKGETGKVKRYFKWTVADL